MAKSLCPYFGRCGGCSFQDVDYDQQLEEKKKRLVESINFDDIQIFPGEKYFYRHRMDMVFHPGGLGFKEKGSWSRIVDVEKCVISNESLNTFIAEVRGFFKDVDYFDLKKTSGAFRFAVIRTPPDYSSVSIVLNKDSDSLAEARDKIKKFANSTLSNNVLATYIPHNRDVSVSDDYTVIKGKDLLQEDYLGKTFMYPVQGFFQNNHEVTEKVHSYCHNLFKGYETGDSHLLDLYGGVGPFGIINADLFKDVTIVESSPSAMNAAKLNIKENKVSNAQAVLLNAKHLKTVDLPQPLFAIVDPARSGIHPKAIKRLNEIKPTAIIYVSCNIKQLVKDLNCFTGFEIKSAALFDLFPHTPHVEAVIELAKRG